jgi:DNA-binding NarL/FixJ family response regulator
VTIDPTRRPRGTRLARSGPGGDRQTVPYPARVIVVDEHDIPRTGLRGVLGGQPELDVITEANNGNQAVALCRRLRPDLVLMELELPGLDGLSAARLIARDCPDTRIVIVTERYDPASLRLAIEAGVSGYLMKTASAEEVVNALRRVLTGELVIDHDLATRALHQMVDAPSWNGAGLTAREHEVLRLVALGKTNQQIGVELAVSTRTAKAHVERIIARLGVANRAEAVARAIGLGMLTPPGVR